MYCPNCDALIPDVSRYCMECGTPIPERAAEGSTAGDVPVAERQKQTTRGLSKISGCILLLFVPLYLTSCLTIALLADVWYVRSADYDDRAKFLPYLLIAAFIMVVIPALLIRWSKTYRFFRPLAVALFGLDVFALFVFEGFCVGCISRRLFGPAIGENVGWVILLIVAGILAIGWWLLPILGRLILAAIAHIIALGFQDHPD